MGLLLHHKDSYVNGSKSGRCTNMVRRPIWYLIKYIYIGLKKNNKAKQTNFKEACKLTYFRKKMLHNGQDE